jgi:hypothetical protein
MVPSPAQGAMPQDRGRRHWTLVGMVALPLLANVLLAAYLAAELDGGGGLPVVGGEAPPPPVVDGDGAPALPESRFERLVSAASEASGEPYECVGPWRAQTGELVWECRTPDAVAMLHGRDPDEVFLLDVTYFGFDERSTDLPEWAIAAFTRESQADDAGEWVRAHVGQGAETSIGKVSIAVNGGEGARTLLVRAEP